MSRYSVTSQELIRLGDAGPADECWEWTRGGNGAGYGICKVNGKKVLVHRLSYMIHVGEIPDGMVVDHICGTTACWNPSHLRLLTHADNCRHLVNPNARNTSGVWGVSWDKYRNKWKVEAYYDGKSYYGGRFDDIDQARKAAEDLRETLGFPK